MARPAEKPATARIEGHCTLSDRSRTLQQQETPQYVGFSPNSPGNHHPHGSVANNALTIKLDRSDEAAHLFADSTLRTQLFSPNCDRAEMLDQLMAEFYSRLARLYEAETSKYACEVWHVVVVLRRN